MPGLGIEAVQKRAVSKKYAGFFAITPVGNPSAGHAEGFVIQGCFPQFLPTCCIQRKRLRTCGNSIHHAFDDEGIALHLGGVFDRIGSTGLIGPGYFELGNILGVDLF